MDHDSRDTAFAFSANFIGENPPDADPGEAPAPGASPSHPPIEAVRCEMANAGYFPQGDARAGSYVPGTVYVVGKDIDLETAAALVEGGGFVAVGADEE